MVKRGVDGWRLVFRRQRTRPLPRAFFVFPISGFDVFGEAHFVERFIIREFLFGSELGVFGGDIRRRKQPTHGLAGFGVFGEGVFGHWLEDFKDLAGFVVFEDDFVIVEGHGVAPGYMSDEVL